LVQPDSIKQDKTMLQPWPWFNANCGDIDFIGNKKPQSYYRDVIYKKSKLEMLVELPVAPGMKNLPNGWGWPSEIKSWTWPGQEGKNLVVSVYSQCTMVRLELNGQVIAEKNMSAADKWKTKLVLPYQPGLLKVTGYENGQPVATSSLSTSGKAVNIGLTADRQTISTGGKDLSYVMVDIRDAQGNWVPDGEHEIHFSVEGTGSLAAVANANPAGMQSFRKPVSKTFHGRCLLIIRSGKKNGKTTIKASAEGMNTAQLIIESKGKQ
jgi:beta-galactosidase